MCDSLLLPPSEKQMEAIMSALGENEDLAAQNLRTLKAWAALQPNISQDCDDRLIGLFLRGCKQDVSKARKKLDVFFNGRDAIPEVYGEWDPCNEISLKVSSFIEIAPLPRLTDDGYRVTVHRFTEHFDCSFHVRDLIRHVIMIAQLRVNTETVIRGDIYVFDLANIVWSHYSYLLSPLLRKILSFVQDGYPQRLRQLHLVNAPPFVNNAINFVRGCMKEKMRDRFVVHRTTDQLHEYLPKSVIPLDYDGCGESIGEVNTRWLKALRANRDNIKHVSNKYVTKKVKKSNSCYSDDLGCQGTFKTLSFD